jgi:hypothetical protein
LTALVSIAVGATAVFGYLALSDRDTRPTTEAVIAATAPRGPIEEPSEPKIADDGTWEDADIRYCADEAKGAADAAAERRLFAVSADRTGLGGPSTEIVERAAHLLCTATRKPRHLCQGYWHNKFTSAFKAYLVAFRDISRQAYWTGYNVAERARRTLKEDQQEILETATSDLRQTTREFAEMEEKITAAFRSLIRDGIIDPDEFGKFFGLGIPPEIAARIGDAQPIRDRCG